jgi:hypothetical protein
VLHDSRLESDADLQECIDDGWLDSLT